jgi:hypothetical protein
MEEQLLVLLTIYGSLKKIMFVLILIVDEMLEQAANKGTLLML